MTANRTPTPVRAFHHWTLTVADLDRSGAFYQDVMGWRPLNGTADPDDEIWGPLPGRGSSSGTAQRFIRDGQRMELVSRTGDAWNCVPAPQVNHLGLSHMTVATGPAEKVLRDLKKCGVSVREHTRSSFVPGMEVPGTQFLFEDPDRNVIETYEAGEDWNAFAGVGGSEPGSANAVGITHLSHWSLCVTDPSRSLPFYRDVLGWQELAVLEWDGPGPSRVMDVGPARLTTWLLGVSDQRIEIIHFTEPEVLRRTGSGVSATGLSHMTIVVDDVGDAASQLTAASCEVLITKGTAGEAVVFEDPDGNVIRGIPAAPTWG